MTQFFQEEKFFNTKRQRRNNLIVFFSVLAVYLIVSIGMFLWYRTLPYMSPTIGTVKLIHYSVSVLFGIFMMIFFGIPFRRVNKFYKMTLNLMNGLKETSVGAFLRYDENKQDKDGVDFKALIFLEWNKYKNDFFERKVLVFVEDEFPSFDEAVNVRYVTQSNVLISYEILDDEQTGDTK